MADQQKAKTELQKNPSAMEQKAEMENQKNPSTVEQKGEMGNEKNLSSIELKAKMGNEKNLNTMEKNTEMGVQKKASSMEMEMQKTDTEAQPKQQQQVEVKADAPLYRRHKAALLACAAVAATLVFLLGLIVLILAFTVFKTHQPDITIDAVELRTLSIGGITLNYTSAASAAAESLPYLSPATLSLFNISSLPDLRVNLTLAVNVSVYNPNHASFRYGNSTSFLYYRELEVGRAPIPAGRIGARDSLRLATSLVLNATSALLSEPNLLPDLAAGSFPMTTSAEVEGRVVMLRGLFKHHARSSTVCSMAISVAARAVQNMTCSYHVKL